MCSRGRDLHRSTGAVLQSDGDLSRQTVLESMHVYSMLTETRCAGGHPAGATPGAAAQNAAAHSGRIPGNVRRCRFFTKHRPARLVMHRSSAALACSCQLSSSSDAAEQQPSRRAMLRSLAAATAAAILPLSIPSAASAGVCCQDALSSGSNEAFSLMV